MWIVGSLEGARLKVTTTIQGRVFAGPLFGNQVMNIQNVMHMSFERAKVHVNGAAQKWNDTFCTNHII